MQHFSTNITNGGSILTDPIFGVQSDGLALSRDAEMYQWVEEKRTKTKSKTGGGKTTTTTYHYNKEWKDYRVDSQSFKRSGYTNPSDMEFTSDEFYASPIMIGAYELPQELVGRVNWYQDVDVDINSITDQTIRNRTIKTSDGYYFGNSPSSPVVGDQRVSFAEVPPSTITIVGVQNGNTLSAFVSETGEGGDVLLFKRGNY